MEALYLALPTLAREVPALRRRFALIAAATIRHKDLQYTCHPGMRKYTCKNAIARNNRLAALPPGKHLKPIIIWSPIPVTLSLKCFLAPETKFCLYSIVDWHQIAFICLTMGHGIHHRTHVSWQEILSIRKQLPMSSV